MTITHRDTFGNAVRICDFGCGGEGTVPLDDVGSLHGCLPCVIRAARRKCVERQIKIERKARGEAASPRPSPPRITIGMAMAVAEAVDWFAENDDPWALGRDLKLLADEIARSIRDSGVNVFTGKPRTTTRSADTNLTTGLDSAEPGRLESRQVQRPGAGIEIVQQEGGVQVTLFYAMVSNQGTACAETGICEHCFSSENQAKAMAWAGGDVDFGRGFVEVTGNEAISCQFCGEVQDG